VVITIFVSQFLDPNKAFPEFFRVLKKDGYFGVNEMYKAEEVPLMALEHVNYGEEIFRDLADLPFTLRNPTSWRSAFESSGFEQVLMEEYSNAENPPYSNNIVGEFGGWGKLLNTLWETIVLALRSSKIRKRYVKIGQAKKVLLRDKETNKYLAIYYVLAKSHESVFLAMIKLHNLSCQQIVQIILRKNIVKGG
jgi:hypothetical protein